MIVSLCPGYLTPIERSLSLVRMNPFYSPAALSFSSREEKKIGRGGEARALSEVSRKFCRGTQLFLCWCGHPRGSTQYRFAELVK